MPVVGFAYLFMSVWRAGTERPVMPETSLLDDETRREGGRRGMSPDGAGRGGARAMGEELRKKRCGWDASRFLFVEKSVTS